MTLRGFPDARRRVGVPRGGCYFFNLFECEVTARHSPFGCLTKRSVHSYSPLKSSPIKTAFVRVLFPVTTAEFPLILTFTSSTVQDATFMTPDLRASRSIRLPKFFPSDEPL